MVFYMMKCFKIDLRRPNEQFWIHEFGSDSLIEDDIANNSALTSRMYFVGRVMFENAIQNFHFQILTVSKQSVLTFLQL